jgi:hypothetical protein
VTEQARREYAEVVRPLENTDVVAWYTFGAHHVVRPEDWSVMPVATVGFILKPAGFFDRNPALNVPRPMSVLAGRSRAVVRIRCLLAGAQVQPVRHPARVWFGAWCRSQGGARRGKETRRAHPGPRATTCSRRISGAVPSRPRQWCFSRRAPRGIMRNGHDEARVLTLAR